MLLVSAIYVQAEFRTASPEQQSLHQTRRLQRRSLRLPTRCKSAQTGHLCTTAQAGADPGIFVCRSNKYGIAIEHMKQKEQYHSFSACVDAGYDIKESTTDIPRDIQQTMQ